MNKKCDQLGIKNLHKVIKLDKRINIFKLAPNMLKLLPQHQIFHFP